MKKQDILIIIKTYPEISKKHRETVCCAGILKNTKKMVRIYPIRYRYLGGHQQFTKYQWIRAEIEKNSTDVRPESYRINPNTIELKNHISTNDDWLERCSWVLDSPHVFDSVEALQASREEKGTSLGIIKPSKILNFRIEKRSIDDFNELNNQKELIFKELDLFEDIKELDILPYRFYLEFRCSNPECTEHKQLRCNYC